MEKTDFLFTKMELRDMLTSAVRTAQAAFLKEMYPAKDSMSQTEAYAAFTRRLVDDWTRRGLTVPFRTGEARNAKLRYSRCALQKLWSTYLLDRAQRRYAAEVSTEVERLSTGTAVVPMTEDGVL